MERARSLVSSYAREAGSFARLEGAPPPPSLRVDPVTDIGDGIEGVRLSNRPKTPFGAVYTAINRGGIGADRAVGVWQKGEAPSPAEASRRGLVVELDGRGAWRWLGPLRDPLGLLWEDSPLWEDSSKLDGKAVELDLERMRP